MISQDTWTVGELVAALSKFDASLPVFTEGCDCIGDVLGVETYSYRSFNRDVDVHGVLITRNAANQMPHD